MVYEVLHQTTGEELKTQIMQSGVHLKLFLDKSCLNLAMIPIDRVIFLALFKMCFCNDTFLSKITQKYWKELMVSIDEL